MIWVRVCSQAVCITTSDEVYFNWAEGHVKPPGRLWYGWRGVTIQVYAFPNPSSPAIARHAGPSRAGARDPSPSGPVHSAAVCLPRGRGAPRDRLDAGQLSIVGGRDSEGVRGGAVAGHRRGGSV